MKKLSIVCGIALVLALMAGPVCAQEPYIWFDINGDGQPDDPCATSIIVGENLPIDLYLNMSGQVAVISVGYNFHWTSATCSVVGIEAPLKTGPTYFGPWDAQGANPAGSYYQCSLFENMMGVPADPAIPLHRFVIQCDGVGACQIDVTDIVVLDFTTAEYYPDDVGCTITQGEPGCLCEVTSDDPEDIIGSGEQLFTASQIVPAKCDNAPNWDWSTNCTEGSLGGDCTTGSNTCTLIVNDPVTAPDSCKVFVTDLANIVSGDDPVTCEADIELKPTTTSIKTTSSTSSISTTIISTTSSIGSTTTTTMPPPPPTTTTIISTTSSIGSTTTTIKICQLKKIYGENSEEIEFLRYFRDNILNQTPEGQKIIKLYYEWSPVIVKAMEEDEKFKEEVKEMIDGVLLLLAEEEE